MIAQPLSFNRESKELVEPGRLKEKLETGKSGEFEKKRENDPVAMAETRTVYLIMSYQVLTDQFLHTLLPAVIGWLSRVKQAGGGGGLGSLPEEVSCVQSQHREGCDEAGGGWVWLLSC